MFCRFISLLLLATIACLIVSTSIATGAAAVASPKLKLILPRGVQRGHEHLLEFQGARLDDAEEIFLYDSPSIEVRELKVIDASKIQVTIFVADDCRLGEHLAQIRTRSGVSDFRSFFVGDLPSVNETEPNNTLKQAQRIKQDVTVKGVCVREDVDHYVVSCKKGQRLSVEIQAMRLGAAFFDPVIAVLNDGGDEIELSDDTLIANQDGLISLVIGDDGDYTISVKDSANRGNGESRYRLHVGKFPRPTIAFPAGGKIGETVSTRLIGDGLGEMTQEITVDENVVKRHELSIVDERGATPSPLKFRASMLDNFLEAEPNNNFDQANDCTLPVALNGTIDQPGEKDWYKFTASKDVTYEFELFSRRIGSPLDSVIHIFNGKRKHLTGNDDSRGSDSYLRWKCPADGDYFFRVYDRFHRGQPDFVYRVEISKSQADLTLGIPRVDRYSQDRQSIVVPRGGRFATRFSVTRRNFSGSVKLDSSTVPDCVAINAAPTDGNQNMMPVVFEASEEADLGGGLVELRAQHVDKPQISGGYLNVADFVLGQPNNAKYITGRTTKVPIVVSERLPFKLEMVTPNVPLLRDGNIRLKIIAHRDEGFDKPIRLEFPHRPPGVGTVGSVTIPKGEVEAYYPLNANTKAKLGTSHVFVIGSADVGGRAWQSTQLVPLEIAERFLTMKIQPAACRQGESTAIVCKVDQLNEFQGDAKAELVGLPPHATSKSLVVDKNTSELVFEVSTSGKTPVGKHRGVFCRFTLDEADESMVAVAGRGQLQIDRPLPKTKASQSDEQKSASVATKPLSRLEKLRLDARQRRESNQNSK